MRKWAKEKLKQTGYMRQSLQEQIPIHRISFDDPEKVRMHDEIVDKVKSIRERMAALAQYSKYFLGPRLTKLPFDATLPEINTEELIKGIDPQKLYNLRTHPEIKIERSKGFNEENFYLRKVNKPELTLTGNAQLKLTGKDKTALFIMGPYDLLKLLADILNNWKGKPWSEIKEKLLLSGNITSFNTQNNNVLNEVQNIRSEILKLQKQIDQIVYKLYELKETEIN